MSSLVGVFWAFIWTIPIPVGGMFFPFWAFALYGYSNNIIWISYFTPIVLMIVLGIYGSGLAILNPFKIKNVEIRSGVSVSLKTEISPSSRLKRLGGFIIDYLILYIFINLFSQETNILIDPITSDVIDINITGGILNSILLLFSIWFIVYGVIPLLTKGSSVGKLIFRTRLYKINENSIEIPDSRTIFQRELLRFIFIAISTYGSYLFPNITNLDSKFYLDLALFAIFFVSPYLTIFNTQKSTIFDSICKTTVASRNIDFTSSIKIEDYESFYNKSDFEQPKLGTEEEE
tara:strand:+ start:2990 stop:3859 length:870 start_codon:yes stop_codon:yes gene_type:complete